MKNAHRSKLSYYRQVYRFQSAIAALAHPSWLEDLPIPKKLSENSADCLAFQSHLLLQPLPPLHLAGDPVQTLFAFLGALPAQQWKRFLTCLVLTVLKNDASLLINGPRLKALSQVLSADEMAFLVHERELRLKLKGSFVLDKSETLDQALFLRIAFAILKAFFPHGQGSPVFGRIKYRFPKSFATEGVDPAADPHGAQFGIVLDAHSNLPCLNRVAQALFPALYSIFESEDLRTPA